MVSALLSDALSNPTESLLELYKASHDVPNFPDLVATHYKRIFASNDAFQQIPVLDAFHPPQSHKPRSLVRFRTMVQDTSISPEVYLFQSKDGILGGWGVSNELDCDGLDYEKLRERAVVWGVNIPGESYWIEEQEHHSTSTSSQTHKYPFPSQPHVGLWIKIYDAQALKPTEIVTCVGILDYEPSPNRTLDSQPVICPTLHVLFTQPLPPTICDFDYPVTEVDIIRQELIGWIADEGLGGDTLAAEWVLLVCIAKVLSRTPALLPPSLTLSRFPRPPPGSDSGPSLGRVLTELLPIAVTIPLSLSLLNESFFAPHSEEEDLHAGVLQLPVSTVVLMTETNIQEGKVSGRGLRNIQTIKETMASQTLTYTFPYSSFSFPTDLNFIVLTEGRKSSFLTTDMVCPVKGTGNMFEKEIRMPSTETMARFRRLVGGAKVGGVAVGEDVAKHIETEFVAQRQASRITAEDLIRRMGIARLVSVSMHKRELTKEVWAKVCEIDEARMARVREAL